jgi:XTP/dITP diphosphohydrolase
MAAASCQAPPPTGAHRPLRGRTVLATHNPGKLVEMRDLMAPYGVAVVSAAALGLPEPEEVGATFAENARIKACAATAGAQLPAVSDDSGLVVAALDGAPGIHSARWAGPDRNLARAMERIETLLQAADARAAAQRRAHFISALCIAWPDGHLEQFEGRVEGTLIWPPRGRQGFGYDPMFLPDGYARTFGEMSGEEKQALPPMGCGLSHRARAFLKLAQACLERH